MCVDSQKKKIYYYYVYIFWTDHLMKCKIFYVIHNICHHKCLWGSKIWAHDLGPGTTFHQQYARGEEITEDRCD